MMINLLQRCKLNYADEDKARSLKLLDLVVQKVL